MPGIFQANIQTAKIDPRLTKIHGIVSALPPGFSLIQVPRSAKFLHDPDPEKRSWFRKVLDPVKQLFRPVQARSALISSNYSLVKIFVAIGQSLYGIATLYESARGDQINRYGYAAFGLTVVPYAYMSLVNLLANLLAPHYPTMYLVESQAMRDASDLIGRGDVGDVDVQSTHEAPSTHEYSTALEMLPNAATGAQGDDNNTQPARESPLSNNAMLHGRYPPGSQEEMDIPPTVSEIYDQEGRSESNDGQPQQRVQGPVDQDEENLNREPRHDDIMSRNQHEESRDDNPLQASPPTSVAFSGTVGVLDPEWDREFLGQRHQYAALEDNGEGRNQQGQATLNEQSISPPPHHEGPRGTVSHNQKTSKGSSVWTVLSIIIAIPLGVVVFALIMVIPGLPIVVVGALSHFRKGVLSTHAQRVWTMTWLAFGIFVGPAVDTFRSLIDDNYVGIGWRLYFAVSVGLFYGAPAVGGFVVVAQMLLAYGVCIRIS